MASPEVFTAIELLVEQSTAEEIMQKGLAEIALRRVDQKFKSMIKCRVASNANNEIGEKILESALNLGSESRSHGISSFQNLLSKVDLASQRLPELDMGIKDLTTKADSILRSTSKLRSCSYINAGLALTNLAVDVSGFYIINERLKDLTTELSSIESGVKELKDISYDSDISRPAKELKVRYGYICDKLKNGKNVSLTELENYLEKLNPFITSMINMLGKETINKDALLSIVFLLLPAYSTVLSLYIKAFYFENHQEPSNYTDFLDVFKMLNSDSFRNVVMDQYFLKGDYSYRETLELLGSQALLLFSERLQIDDLVRLLDIFNSEETYNSFEEKTDELARQQVESSIKEISEKSGVDIDECRRVLEVQ